MKLTGPEIQRRIAEGQIGINPYNPEQLGPNSYNLRLSINTENQYYINDFGYILSHFDKINYICMAEKN